MSDIFISYARPSEADAQRIAGALRALGWGVWRDDELPPHRAYAEVIEERLRAAKAVLVLWTAEAVKSQWVRAEADLARGRGVLVQLSLDGAIPPLPFNQIQCADLRGWTGEDGHPAWRKIVSSVAELMGGAEPGSQVAAEDAALLAGEKPVVTIKPFKVVSGSDPDGVAAGLSEEVRTALSRYTTMSVAGARKAGALEDYVLEGSVQQAGERLRVSVNLVASDGTQVWNERFEGSRPELFDLQDRVAVSVGANVEASIRSFEMERAASAPEEALNSRQLFYRGMKFLRRWDREGMSEALRIMERVLELEPGNLHALASAGALCSNLRTAGFYDEGEEPALRRKGVEYCERVIDTSDADPYATGLAAVCLAMLGRPVAPLRALLDRILALTPSFPFAWFWSGTVRLAAGDLETALEHLRRSLELDPRTAARPVVLSQIGAALVLLDRFDEAYAALTEAIQIRTHVSVSRMYLAICLARMGRLEEARSTLAACEAITPVSRVRFTLHNHEQRRKAREGLALAGFEHPEVVIPDV